MEEMSGKGFKMQALAFYDVKFFSTRTAVGQFKGAMEEMSICRRPAYITRFVRIQVGVGQRGRAIHINSSTLPGKASVKRARVTFHRGDG